MKTHTPDELDAMDRKAAEWMGWQLVQEEGEPDAWCSNGGAFFEYYVKNWHPTRDLNQVREMEERLDEKGQIIYIAAVYVSVQRKLRHEGFAATAEWWFAWNVRHAPAPVCVECLLKVRKT